MPIKDKPPTSLETRALVKLATSAFAVPASAGARRDSPGIASLVCANCRWCCICRTAKRAPSQMRALLDVSRQFLERPGASPVNSQVLDRYDARITDNLELCRKHLTSALLRSVRTILRTRMMADRAHDAACSDTIRSCSAHEGQRSRMVAIVRGQARSRE
jgi:hypothetical protein